MGFIAHQARALRAVLGTLAAALAVAGCGGGSSHNAFVPTRLVAFGDEASVITSDGHKYTVNALDSTNTTLVCSSNPIWVQVLASAYGFGFAQCQPEGITNQNALTRAAAGAKAADLAAQIDAFVLNVGDFTEKDLVTVLVGTNDIVEQYQTYPTQSADTINAELAVRGAAVAAQINRIANAGGKVLAVTVPDAGLTPYALAEKAAHSDTDRQALLRQFTASFNLALRLGLLNDGRKIGLVLGDELVQSFVAAGTVYFANVTEHACDPNVAMPNCTTATLFTDSSGAVGSAASWLWADDLQLTPGGHARLASAALTRAQNNPF